MDLGGSFLEVNDTYLDVGQSNFNKAFQAQLMIWVFMSVLIVCLIVGPTIVGLGTFGDLYGRSFVSLAAEMLPSGALIALLGGGLFAILGCYSVISTTLQKARTRPMRFNRQRREVCYFPSGSDEPIIQPWEELVAWVSVSTGTTGEGIMSTYTLGMALDNPKTDKTHFLNQGVLTPAHGLSKWEAIRVYMEKGPAFCPGKAPYEGRHTFDEERESMREAYRGGYCSAFGVAFWYVRNVVTWWRFPYWVAEWDHRYSMKPMPASIEQWSQPLPPTQWAKPSSALLEQTAQIEKAFAQGQSFMDYFNSTLGYTSA
ncbi:MAG: hypothetical protein KJ884_07560 [Gammaproteobacteria bacterium]|nr:hypothetical protein [Gammaproteobacteria bacterium]MBU2067003.1 hypothetical protein [Gammaproteobacteria bacterium]MBU2138958.1 hypothetical protein [Gammaproteobacteria bacterium]MBU2216303.1 hypothetical protein [Gammaproteobacteria bacterium]MBU2322809.1 hypothetical protein [Gammaproteobacteria bacterium]